MASRARYPRRAASALQACMVETAEQCSHEDENTRVVCMETSGFACGGAVSPNRSTVIAIERIVNSYSSTAVARVLRTAHDEAR